MRIIENQKFVKSYIQNEIPQLKATSFYDTCFLRLNFAKMIGCGLEAVMFIKKNTGLYFSYGEQENQEFLRVNTACKRSELNELLSLLID